MKKTNKFSPEVRERAVRMVREQRGEYPSLWAAIESIAPKIASQNDGELRHGSVCICRELDGATSQCLWKRMRWLPGCSVIWS
ncbi:hypothetical protein [Acidovorax sp. Leaf73]|jgi:transposase-like protein|uniref:hypothetical protein n=1 Tax=Acidovorax sp. Leaf73 TaxID=2876566 RepID=UPI001E4774B2|nr:hypothetical protein [Acidovorax sp. Leaf73]